MGVLTPLALLADLIGVIGATFAAFAWYQAKRLREETNANQAFLNQRISVVMKLDEDGGPRQIELPVQLRRYELTRAELLGRLGMLPMKDKGRRFSLDHLATPAFLENLDRVHSSEADNVLLIPCSPDEIRQFDLPAAQAIGDV